MNKKEDKGPEKVTVWLDSSGNTTPVTTLGPSGISPNYRGTVGYRGGTGPPKRY